MKWKDVSSRQRILLAGGATVVLIASIAAYVLWPETPRDLYIQNTGYWTKLVVVQFKDENGWRYAGPWILQQDQATWADTSSGRIRPYGKKLYVYTAWAPFASPPRRTLQDYIDKEKFERVDVFIAKDESLVLDVSQSGNFGPVAVVILGIIGVCIWVGVRWSIFERTTYTDLTIRHRNSR